MESMQYTYSMIDHYGIYYYIYSSNEFVNSLSIQFLSTMPLSFEHGIINSNKDKSNYTICMTI